MDGSSGILASGAASRGGRGSRGGSASRGGRGALGGHSGTAPGGERGDSTPQRPTTRPVEEAPNARTISTLRRLACFTKGEFPDISFKDDPVSFVEYAYSVKITQPNVRGTFEEAMKLPDAELLRAAAKREMDNLEDVQVYKLVPGSTVPPTTRV